MPRVSAHERGGLDLLELLYRNNLLVHIWFAEDERQTLTAIAQRFRHTVKEAGFSGLEAESLIHCGLCLVEIYASDDAEDLLSHESFSDLPEGLTREQYIKVGDVTQSLMAAFSLAVMGISLPSVKALTDVLMDLALHVAGELKRISSVCRVRFTERVFAAEYPDAPISVFSWLAAMGVIEPGEKKYSKPEDASAFDYDDQVFRAALLVQFESIRKWLLGATSSKDAIKGMYSKLTTTRDASTIEAMSKWEDAVGERVHMPKLKNKILVLDHAAWGLGHEEHVRSTFARFPSLAPSYQAFLTKKSTALTDIAGAMIRTHPWDEDQMTVGRFSHTSDSKAEFVRAELGKRGFTVGARTLHIHNRDSVQKHVDLTEYYSEMLRRMPFVISCEHEDARLIYLNGRDKTSLNQSIEERKSLQAVASKNNSPE